MIQGYKINALTLAADYAGAFDKEGSSKDRFNGFRVADKYQVTPAVTVYGNYGYGVAKDKTGNVTDSKDVVHKFMVGSSYQVHKNVLTYVEGSVGKVKTTDYTKNTKTKTSDNSIGVGLRVFW